MNDPAAQTPVFTPANGLAFYGTLRRGEINHHVVNRIEGTWLHGVIKGYVFDVSWGGADGFPGFVPDPNGNDVPVEVLVCDDWDRHVDQIDRFEGPGYRRIEIDVFDAESGQPLGRAQVYECLTDND